MFKLFSKIDTREFSVSESWVYLLINTKINGLEENSKIIKIGHTSKEVEKRLKEYTFNHNQPNEILHDICKAHGITNKNQYVGSWKIEKKWVISSKFSSKKIENKIREGLRLEVEKGLVSKFGNSEYYSINEQCLQEFINKLDNFVARF